MAAVKLPINHPHVTVQNDILELTYRGKRYKISVENISKIYLSKRKTGYLTAMIDNLLLMRHMNFKLYIQTTDSNSFSIDIPDGEKQLFVNLISWVRSKIAANASKLPEKKVSANPPVAHNGAFAA